MVMLLSQHIFDWKYMQQWGSSEFISRGGPLKIFIRPSI